MSATRLSGVDAAFLELEDADPGAHMHIGGILIFGRAERRRGAPSIADVRGRLEVRLEALPRYRQRLSVTHAGGFTRPRWAPDPRFDIARHIRRAVLPPPGGCAELLEWAEDFYSRRLDRTAPLWEMIVLEGLDHGRWAMATKTHHCLVDGVGSMDVAQLLFGDVAGPPAPAARTAPGRDLVEDVWHGVAGAADLARHPAAVVRTAASMAEWLLRDELRAAPHTSLNVRIGGARRLRAATVSITAAEGIRALLGGTLNDVALAGVAGGLRTLLLSRGESLPERGLRVMVPRNLRMDDGRGGLGNRVSALFVELPLAEPDALTRYERIREATAAAKVARHAAGADAILRLADLTPPLVEDIFARPVWGRRLFNVTVTNVPGPPGPLSLLGSPLVAIYPVVPLAADHAVGFAVTSCAERLIFGINADRASMPDVDVLASGLRAAIAELQAVCAD